ncbi:MAG: hypothetical protein Q7R93_04350 [bacterium]|nr:hypothetical protein [bacterium]
MKILEHLDRKAVLLFAGIFIVLAGIFFYWLYGKADTGTPSITALSSSPLDATLGRELLAALAKLKSTKLDGTIFDDPVFSSLKDFGVEIASQPVGRRNPFGVLDGSAASKHGSSGVKASAFTPPKTTGKAATSTPAGKPPVQTGGFDLE